MTLIINTSIERVALRTVDREIRKPRGTVLESSRGGLCLSPRAARPQHPRAITAAATIAKTSKKKTNYPVPRWAARQSMEYWRCMAMRTLLLCLPLRL